jgi:hypothetical protein
MGQSGFRKMSRRKVGGLRADDVSLIAIVREHIASDDEAADIALLELCGRLMHRDVLIDAAVEELQKLQLLAEWGPLREGLLALVVTLASPVNGAVSSTGDMAN